MYVQPQMRMPAPQAQRLPPPPPTTALPPPPPQAAQAPRPQVARGKIDDPAPAPTPAWKSAPRLSLPEPEQLGVTAAGASAGVDWNATHARLRRLGAVGWQLGRLPQGAYRFTFVLPTADANRTRHVEATGASEAEAVRLALASVEP